jgi:hypothetical protein
MYTQITAKPGLHLRPVNVVIPSRIYVTSLVDICTPFVVSYQFVTDTSAVFCGRGNQNSCIVVVVPVEMDGYCVNVPLDSRCKYKARDTRKMILE